MARPAGPVEFDIIEEFVTLDTSVTFDTIAVLVVAEGTNFNFKGRILSGILFSDFVVFYGSNLDHL